MGDAGSVLVMVSTPDVTPLALGANVTFTAQDEPALMVVMPQVLLTLKPALAENDRPSAAVLLVFSSVSAWVDVLPTTTSPKLSVVGATDNCGCVPTPDKGTVSG